MAENDLDTRVARVVHRIKVARPFTGQSQSQRAADMRAELETELLNAGCDIETAWHEPERTVGPPELGYVEYLAMAWEPAPPAPPAETEDGP